MNGTVGSLHTPAPLALARAMRPALVSIALVACLGQRGVSAQEQAADASARSGSSLDETRLKMGKWIETQQLIAKERKDWQQAKELHTGRVEVLGKEITSLDEKITVTEVAAAEAGRKRDRLVAEKAELQAAEARLAEAVSGFERELRRLAKAMPEPVRAKFQTLFQRIPDDPANARVSVAERFQNVLGILNEMNKANNEITVHYEVRNLMDGKPAEVKAVYVGLAQAFYVSAGGEAGVGYPTPEGWKWEPRNGIARAVANTLDILQGQQSPAFVPLPVRLQ